MKKEARRAEINGLLTIILKVILYLICLNPAPSDEIYITVNICWQKKQIGLEQLRKIRRKRKERKAKKVGGRHVRRKRGHVEMIKGEDRAKRSEKEVGSAQCAVCTVFSPFDRAN